MEDVASSGLRLVSLQNLTSKAAPKGAAMAIKGLRASSTSTFVSKSDPCYSADGNHKEGATKFVLRTLDGHLQARLQDLGSQMEIDQHDAAEAAKTGATEIRAQLKMSPFTAAMEACRLAIADWENFEDPDKEGQLLKCKTRREQIGRNMYDVLEQESLKAIQPDLALEIYMEIKRLSALTGADVKNSVAVS